MFSLWKLFRCIDGDELTPLRARVLASKVQGKLVALAILAADRLLKQANADGALRAEIDGCLEPLVQLIPEAGRYRLLLRARVCQR